MDKNSSNQWTRRDFAKASLAAGVAVMTSRSASAQQGGDILKVGLLGCGGRGTGAAINCLEGNANVRLVAMADLFPDRLENARQSISKHANPQVSAGYQVTDEMCFLGLDAYKKIIATDIDILIEGTLPYSRSYHIEAAVKAGKHVFTEKPVAVDPVGVRRVIAAANEAKAKNLTIVAGTQRRHQQEYIETIKKIHDGAIGELVAGAMYWLGGTPFIHDRKPDWSDLEYRIRNWVNYCWTGGANIVEQHVHNLDVANWVLGAHPLSVIASGGRAWKPTGEKFGDIFDNFSCDYEYPNGIHIASFSRWWNGADSDVREDIVGTKGRSNCRDLAEKGMNPYVQEHIDLVKSILGAGPYYNEGVQVAESTMTSIMGRMSAYTGKRITWDEAMASDLSIVPEEISFDKEYPVGPIPVPGKPLGA